MGLRAYIIKRVIYSFVLLFFVITLNFVIFELMPGNQGTIDLLANSVRFRGNNTIVKQLLHDYGLDQPPLVRYEKYAINMLTWNFGRSYQGAYPEVKDEILNQRLGNTLLLVGTSTVVSIILGLFLGVYAARKRGSMMDNASVITSLVTYSLPTFWMGIMLILVFFSTLHWLPLGAPQPFAWSVSEYRPTDLLTIISVRLQHLILPVATLTLFFYGGYLLLTRATMLEALGEDYILTARAKGLPERSILFKHALRNASLPLITQAALAFGFLLTGAIITEQVFLWNGLGQYIWRAIQNKDFPVLQAMFYVVGLSVIVANFISDLAYGIVDPRIKYE